MNEQWKPLKYKQKDFTGLYVVSNLGRVRNLANEKISYVQKTHNNRAFVALRERKYKSIQAILNVAVWQSFNGEIKHGFCTEHIDENKQNNRLDNLRLVNLRRRKSVSNRALPTGVTASQTKGKVVAAIRLKNDYGNVVINLGTYLVKDQAIASQAYEMSLKMIENNTNVTEGQIKNAVSDYRVSVGYAPFFRRTEAYNNRPIKKRDKKKKLREGFTHEIINW